VDKFVGDEIVAIFGAPQELPDHAVRACRAIVRMQRRVNELGPVFASLGARPRVYRPFRSQHGPRWSSATWVPRIG